jgi:hypothetical protein
LSHEKQQFLFQPLKSVSMKKSLFVSVFALIITLIQCKGSVDVVPCSDPNPTYTGYVKAIMDTHCASADCHSASKKQSGYDLSSYVGTKSGSAKDAFLGSMQEKFGYSKMPRGASKLPDSVLTKIACWVQNGTPQ